jgi:hypothetical protein
MKYLKLYENFNNNIEDTLEDIKWVLVEMTERYELLGHEKDYCMLYEISNMPSEEDMESAVGRLEDIGYELVYVGKPAIASRDLQGKTICWIVKSEFCEEYDHIITMKNLENNSVIEELQNNILLKMWKEDPVLDNDRLQKLCIFNYQQIQKVADWFREYLGPNAKKIIDSILRGNDHHISKGGYEFDIEIVSYDIKDDVEIFCEILPGGEVSIIMEPVLNLGRTLDIEEAVNDEEIGWEIKGEISDCIEDYFYKDLQIRNKTGYSIVIQYDFK